MDNIFLKEQYESDEQFSEEEIYNEPNNRFMNMIKIDDFEKNQKRLFNRDIIKKNIVIDSHNYYQGNSGDGESFNASDFTVLFDLEDDPVESYQEKITTNYDIFKNVIGFRLLKAIIRTPPFNVNTSNNVIKYRRTGSSDRDENEILTITINPGVYTLIELADAFQKFEGYYDQEIDDGNESRVNISKKNTQYVTYSDNDAGLSGWSGGEPSSAERKWRPWIPREKTADEMGQDHPNLPTSITANTFRVSFIESNHRTSNVSREDQIYPFRGPLNTEKDNLSGMRFLFEFNSKETPSIPGADTSSSGEGSNAIFKQNEEFEILWDYNSVTKGAARLFGFPPTNMMSNNREIISEKMPNFDSQYVDLVIPEIPSIACKRNSSGREIIERIQLKEGHGNFLHYKTPNDGIEQQYFNPIKIHRLTAQLWAVNNILYDNNNSDVSYEFEITMLKNLDLLR